jgi:hypothetical protein
MFSLETIFINPAWNFLCSREDEQRPYGLDAWRESPDYTDRERAALAGTEAVTRITDGHVPDQGLRRSPPALQRKRTGRPDFCYRDNLMPGTAWPSPPAQSRVPTKPQPEFHEAKKTA